MSLEELYHSALRGVDELRGFELLASLSRLHRLQGSDEIVVAAEHVAQLFDELGIEYRFENLQGPLGLHEYWGFWEPRGWVLSHASLEARGSGRWRTIVSSEETPIVAIAGSPPGSAEGVLRLGEAPIAAVNGFSQALYYSMLEEGVAAVVAFHLGPGIRYWGLYPPHFLSPPSVPAISVPGRDALSLVGEKVRVSVESSYNTLSKTPILRAQIGEGNAAITLVSHICHPRPGSHDNASGVAVLVETLASLTRFAKDFTEKGVRVEALIVPEWTGTAAAHIYELLVPAQILGGLSVDMVAARLSETSGILRLVRSPPPLLNVLDPVLDTVLSLKDRENYGSSTPYEPGSDHDILLSLGAPASMLNEWPDRFYHTNLDTPDHISVNRLKSISSSLAASILYTVKKPVEALVEKLRNSTYPQAIDDSTEYGKLIGYGLEYGSARLKRILRGEEPPAPSWPRDLEVKKRLPTQGYLYLSGYKELAKEFTKNRKRYEAFLIYSIVASGTESTSIAEKFLRIMGIDVSDREKSIARKFIEGEISLRTG